MDIVDPTVSGRVFIPCQIDVLAKQQRRGHPRTNMDKALHNPGASLTFIAVVDLYLHKTSF